MEPLTPEQYRIIHQRIRRAVMSRELRSRAIREQVDYGKLVADHVMRPYEPGTPTGRTPPEHVPPIHHIKPEWKVEPK